MMLNYLLAAGIGAMSSILANKNVAVYMMDSGLYMRSILMGGWIGNPWLPHPLP